MAWDDYIAKKSIKHRCRHASEVAVVLVILWGLGALADILFGKEAAGVVIFHVAEYVVAALTLIALLLPLAEDAVRKIDAQISGWGSNAPSVIL
jgi:hypothetical protein